MLLNERCCEKEKQILCSCMWAFCQVKHGKKLSHVRNFQLGDLQNSRGEWMELRETCAVKELQKAPFFVFKSQGPLEACHASATTAPSYLTPFSKATTLSTQAFRQKTHSAAALLSLPLCDPPSPQASPTVFLLQLDNGKQLNREVATIFLWLNEVLELSCAPKKEMTITVANELFIFY